MNSIIINKTEFKKYNDTYYISRGGEVYSAYAKRIIKPLERGRAPKTYFYIDIWNGEKQVHTNIHNMVYTVWVGEIKEGQVIRHLDDNSKNNNVENLSTGTQQQNIQDSIDNETRVGNVFYLTVYDKQEDKVLTFCPAKDFIEYSGHPCGNGSLKRMFSRNWFKVKYEILDYQRINNLEQLKSVTTMGDECTPVE